MIVAHVLHAAGVDTARGLRVDRRAPCVLRGLFGLGLPVEPFAVHALTVGAIGGLTLGMMTRTARGHTGRPPKADRFEFVMFVLVRIAAAVRVFGGIAPSAHLASAQLSGLLWTAAFGLYALRY